jgi:hypothetical protein
MSVYRVVKNVYIVSISINNIEFSYYLHRRNYLERTCIKPKYNCIHIHAKIKGI